MISKISFFSSLLLFLSFVGLPHSAIYAENQYFPQQLSSLPQGALIVWSEFQKNTNKSLIRYQKLSAEGHPTGMPQTWRETSGEVLALSFKANPQSAFVAWTTRFGDDQNPKAHFLTAALPLHPKTLVPLSKPIEVSFFGPAAGTPWGLSISLPLLLTKNGNAILVTGDQGTSYAVFSVTPLGVVTLLGKKATGSSGAMNGIMHLGEAVLAEAYHEVGGPIRDDALFSLDPTKKVPSLIFPECGQPFSRFWTGSQLIMYCPNDYWLFDSGKEQPCPFYQNPENLKTKGDQFRCPTLYLNVQQLKSQKKQLSSKLLVVSEKIHCEQNHPILELTYLQPNQQKSMLRLDPFQKESSMELSKLFSSLSTGDDHGMAYTGQALLLLKDMGDHTLIQPYTCTPKGELQEQMAISWEGQ